jgi:hypothetical protein
MPDYNEPMTPGGGNTQWGGNMGNSTASAAGVAGGAFGMAGTIISAIAQKYATRANMDYQNEWAYRQREWALQDRDYQNWYNSPVEQRKRMIAAGINPALMYGNGSGTVQAASVRSTPSPQANIQAPDFSGIGSAGIRGLQMYYEIKMQEAQLRQMEIKNDLLAQQTQTQKSVENLNIDRSKLTEAQNERLNQILEGVKQYNRLELGTHIGTDVAAFEPLSYDAAKFYADVQKVSNQANALNGEYERREMYAKMNAEQIVERIALMRAQEAKTEADRKYILENLDVLKKTGILKQIDIDSQQIITKQFTGPAGQLLLSIMKAIGLGK